MAWEVHVQLGPLFVDDCVVSVEETHTQLQGKNLTTTSVDWGIKPIPSAKTCSYRGSTHAHMHKHTLCFLLALCKPAHCDVSCWSVTTFLQRWVAATLKEGTHVVFQGWIQVHKMRNRGFCVGSCTIRDSWDFLSALQWDQPTQFIHHTHCLPRGLGTGTMTQPFSLAHTEELITLTAIINVQRRA